MAGLVGTLVVFTVVFAGLFGILCSVTGEASKGNTILVNCMTVVILYLVLLIAFNMDSGGDGLFHSVVPMLEGVDRYGSVKDFFHAAPAGFALGFVELVTLSLVISFLSNLLSFEQVGFWGKFLSRLVLVFVGLLAYGALMDAVSGNIVMKWCCYAVEMLITGSAVAYTPLMLATTITGLKTNHWLAAYLIQILPKTSIGKAISAAVTSSVMFLAMAVVLETQYGSVKNILQGSIAMAGSAGGTVILCMGIYVLLHALKIA